MKAYIEEIEESEWLELAPFNKDILNNGLVEIGLHSDEIEIYNKELTKLKIEKLNKNMPGLGHIGGAKGGALIGGALGGIVGGAIGEIGMKRLMKTGGDSAEEYKKSIIDFLKEKLGTLSFEKEKEDIIDASLPIFKFNSPKINGSEVLYESSISETIKNSFSMTVFGSGLGKTHKIKIASTNSFLCTNGSYKLVYIPLKIKSSLIIIRDKKGELKNQLGAALI